MDSDPDTQDPNRESRLPRLLIVASGFIAFEALFIATLGDSIYDFGYFSPGMWGLLALAGAGYLALGFFSGSWISGMALVAPLVIAAYFVNVVWVSEFESAIEGRNQNFTEIWLSLSLIFIPAWAFGVVWAKKKMNR